MLRTASAFAFSLVSLFAGVGQAHGDDASRISELKSQIRSIAIENLGRRDNLEQTRALIEPLALELAKYHNPADAAADVPALEGAWKELFSDDVEPEPPGFSTVRDEVYQVITSNGYFYNFGNLAGPGPLKVLGVLRGEYTPAEDFLNIEFTKVSIRARPLRSGELLMDVVEKIEAGSMATFTPPGDNRAPRGPVGAKGNIRNLFIDSDFRVATGSNFADGKYDLYILDKVTTPVSYK